MKKMPLDKVNLNMPVKIFKQDDVYVAYAPLLDMSTYGESEKEAQLNFKDMLDAFFSNIEDVRELAQILESLGWQKQNSKWQPPKVKETKIKISSSLMGV